MKLPPFIFSFAVVHYITPLSQKQEKTRRFDKIFPSVFSISRFRFVEHLLITIVGADAHIGPYGALK
jgi:hypothetical protein